MDALAFTRLVQTRLGVAADGVVGPITLAALDKALPEKEKGPKGDRFPKVLTEVLRHEGGYVDHPRDPGGATNLGVTMETLKAWRVPKPVSKSDVKALTVADVTPIYRKRYWDAVRGDDLPAGVDLMTFDLAVNSGPSRAIKFLQESVGVAADGIMGPITIEAVNANSAEETIRRMAQRREAFYRSLATFNTFGKGWMKRLQDVKAKALIAA